MPVSSNVQDFHAKSSSLNSQVRNIEREYASINFNYYKRIHPTLSPEAINTKVYDDRLKVIEKLYTIFPTLQSDTNLTPELMIKDVNQASSKIIYHCNNTIRDIALAESGVLAGGGDHPIDIEPFISEMQVAVPTGKKIKQYITVPDEEDPTVMLTTPDYLEVDEFTYETVTVIKDKASFGNTINNIYNQSIIKATQEVDEKLENYNQLIEDTKINNQNNNSESLDRDAIRFEAAKLIKQIMSGATVQVDDGKDTITLDWMAANKKINATSHYLELINDLEKDFLESNGVVYVEEDKIVQQSVELPDGTFAIEDTTKKISRYKTKPYEASNFGNILFSNVKVENPSGIIEEKNLFDLWRANLHKEIGINVGQFLDNPDSQRLSSPEVIRENDSKIYSLFIHSMNMANKNTPVLTNRLSQNSDCLPIIPPNIFERAPQKASLFNDVTDIYKSNTKSNDNILMSNYGNQNALSAPQPQQNNNQQVPALPNNPAPQMTTEDRDTAQSLNTLQQILGSYSSL